MIYGRKDKKTKVMILSRYLFCFMAILFYALDKFLNDYEDRNVVELLTNIY